MKRLNVKLLLIVLATVVVLTVGVISVHAIQTNRNVGNLLKLAQESTAARDYKEAVNFYLRYLQHNPDDSEQFANFALVYLKFAESQDGKMEDLRRAVGALTESVKKLQINDPANQLGEVRETLVDVLLKHGAFVQAMGYLERMKADNTAAKKDDPSVDLRLAECKFRTAYNMEALKLLEPLVGYDRTAKTFDAAKATAPKEIKAYALIAVILRDRITNAEMPDRETIADQVMEQLAKVNPDDPKAILARAQDLLRRSPENARSLIDQALTVAPNDPDSIWLAAQVAATLDKDYEKAEKLLRHGVKENPKDSRLHNALVMVFMSQNNMEDAQAAIEDGLKKLPNDPDLLNARCGLQILKKDFVGAQNTLKLMDTAQVSPAVRELLECRLLFVKSDFAQAARRLEALRPKIAGNANFQRNTDEMLVQAYSQLGQLDKVKEILPRLPGESLNVHVNKAHALLAEGKSAEALAEYERIAKGLPPEQLGKSANVWQPLYQLRASEILRLPKEERNWQSVDSLLALVREHSGIKEPNISLLELDVMVRKGEDEQVKQRLQALASQYPNDSAVLATVARFAVQDGKFEEAWATLDRISADSQSEPAMIGARIDCILGSQDSADIKIDRLVKFGESAAKWPDDARFNAYRLVGAALAQLADLPGAQRWLGKAGEVRPEDVPLRWTMFELARATADQEAMKDVGKWFSTKLGADSAQAKLAEAAQLVTAAKISVQGTVAPNQKDIPLSAADRQSLKNARRLLNETKTRRPGWHEVPKLLAEINMLEGQFDEAINNFEEALTLGPPNGRMIQQLLYLLAERNRFPDAKKYIDKYKSLVGGEMDRLVNYVNAVTGAGGALSEEELNKLVDPNSNRVGDQLYMATLLSNSGKSEEAEAAFRKAVALDPDSAQAWLALVGHLHKNDKRREAHEVVQEAQIQLPEDRRALVLAQSYEVLGDLGQAEQFYLSALDGDSDDPAVLRAVATHYLRTNRIDRARPYLDKIVANPPPEDRQDENFSWARREVAKLIAMEPDYQRFLKAIEMLKPAKGATPNPQDLTLQAALLAGRADEPASARQGLHLLSVLDDQRPLTMVEQLLQAQLKERLGDWTAASTIMSTLVSQSKPLPTIFVAYVDMLLRNGRASDADRMLQSLKRQAPETPEILTLSARVDAAQGRGAQAAAQLKKELPSQRPLPKEQWPRLLAIAGLLEQIGQYDEAEKLLREYVGYVPEQSLILAKFLADRGKVDQAIALVEQLRRSYSASPLLQVLLIAMRQKVVPPTPQQIEKVQSIFERAMRDDPESSLVQIQLAGLREFQGNYEEAEKLYRQILARSETRPGDRAIVSNNLAYILAIQGKQLDEALKLVNQAIAYTGPKSDILDTRGLIYLGNGKIKEAVADLSEAVHCADELNRGAKYVHLAIAQAAAKDEAGARSSLQEAKRAKLNPAELPPKEREKYEALLRQLGLQA